MKKFLKSPWTIGIGTTVFGGVLLTFVLDLIQGVDWLSTLKTVIHFIVKCITSFLNFNIKVWWLLIAIAAIIGILWIIVKCNDRKEQDKEPQFLEYTQDHLLGYSWEWTYEKLWDGKYSISNLHPVCTTCRTPLKQGGSWGLDMICLRCKKSKQWNSAKLDEARLLIEDNIKKKYFSVE